MSQNIPVNVVVAVFVTLAKPCGAGGGRGGIAFEFPLVYRTILVILNATGEKILSTSAGAMISRPRYCKRPQEYKVLSSRRQKAQISTLNFISCRG